MSTNAGTWFYNEPEHRAFLISERLNNTFWQARLMSIYWQCTQAEPPFKAVGYLADQLTVEITWEAGQWLALAVPPDVDAEALVAVISQRILGKAAAISYSDVDGRTVIEWHIDGGDSRWKTIQGRATFANPRRLG